MNEYLNCNDCKTEAEFMYWLDISTERSALAQSRAEGVAEGAAKERAKAQAEKLDMARKMKAKNYPIEDIAELTGLTAEEIENI